MGCGGHDELSLTATSRASSVRSSNSATTCSWSTCWPCIFARKSEIRKIADTDPARIDEIRALEAELGEKMTARAAAKGEPVRMLPTFFQGTGRDSKDGVRGAGLGTPIDQVVEWSRTLRGGKEEDRQEELFAVADEGCMRWGLCETAPPSRAWSSVEQIQQADADEQEDIIAEVAS